eukprot:scaffold20270_cov125-Skeletonema_marinoi.AAC.4
MALLSVDDGDCLIVRLVVVDTRRFVTDGIAEKWRAHPAVRHERASEEHAGACRSSEGEIGISLRSVVALLLLSLKS